MAQASDVLFWFSLALYIGATVLYAYQFVLRRSSVGWWASFFTGAGFICQTLSIGARSQSLGTTEFTGANQLMLASWALVLIYFVMEHIIKIKIYGTFLIPVAAVLMAMARVVYNLAPSAVLTGSQAEQLDSWRVAFHVALIVFANAGFAFGAVSAMLYLWQDGRLKKHKSNVVTRRLPSLATLKSVARRSISFAFPVYTAGLLLGILRAIEESVPSWWFDPRIMMAGLVWFTFGLYLTLVYRHNASTRTTSRVAAVGFLLVVITAIIARTVPAGFHVFGL